MEVPLNLKIPVSGGCFRNPIELSNEFPIDLTTPHLKIKRRSSFFNIEKAVVREKLENQKRKEYIERLEGEVDIWRTIVNDTIAKNKQLKNMKILHDSSILSQERKDYLGGAVDINKFVDNTEALSDCVYFYTKETEWKDMQVEFNEKMLEEKIIDAASNIV